MRSTLLLTSLLTLVTGLALSACTSEPETNEHGPASAGPLPGRAPPEPEPEPAAAPEPAAPATEPETPPEPIVEPDPVMAERKQALANVGRSAFDALKAGEFDALLALTPLVDPYLGEVCPGLPLSPKQELQARFNHCHTKIDWDAVAEAQAFAGKPSGAQASGCNEGIEDYGRLQLFLHMQDAAIWKIEFFGAVGEDGNAIGINGEVKCSETDDAPKLR